MKNLQKIAGFAIALASIVMIFLALTLPVVWDWPMIFICFAIPTWSLGVGTYALLAED